MSHSLTHDHPLLRAVRRCLSVNPQGVSEYQLMTWLGERLAGFPPQLVDPDLALFQRHFLVMHALYQLQPYYAERGLRLQISALRIELLPLGDRAEPAGLPAAAGEQKLRDYYTDLTHLDQTCGEQVRVLLQSFWERMLADDQSVAALAVLELPAGADWEDIVQRYRQLVAKHHPDRGGDPRRFGAVREAYEVLKRWVGPSTPGTLSPD